MIYNLTMEKIVYLDNAATTSLDKNVIEKMLPYMSDNFGNPNSLHTFGRRAVMAVDDSRDTVARLIGQNLTKFTLLQAELKATTGQ